MTNFEKWKQNLKIEDLIIDNGEDVDEDEFYAEERWIIGNR